MWDRGIWQISLAWFYWVSWPYRRLVCVWLGHDGWRDIEQEMEWCNRCGDDRVIELTVSEATTKWYRQIGENVRQAMADVIPPKK